MKLRASKKGAAHKSFVLKIEPIFIVVLIEKFIKLCPVIRIYALLHISQFDEKTMRGTLGKRLIQFSFPFYPMAQVVVDKSGEARYNFCFTKNFSKEWRTGFSNLLLP